MIAGGPNSKKVDFLSNEIHIKDVIFLFVPCNDATRFSFHPIKNICAYTYFRKQTIRQFGFPSRKVWNNSLNDKPSEALECAAKNTDITKIKHVSLLARKKQLRNWIQEFPSKSPCRKCKGKEQSKYLLWNKKNWLSASISRATPPGIKHPIWGLSYGQPADTGFIKIFFSLLIIKSFERRRVTHRSPPFVTWLRKALSRFVFCSLF